MNHISKHTVLIDVNDWEVRKLCYWINHSKKTAIPFSWVGKHDWAVLNLHLSQLRPDLYLLPRDKD